MHGMPDLTQPEYAWTREPISHEELKRLAISAKSHMLAVRCSPNPSQFVMIQLLHLVLEDYERLRFGTETTQAVTP